MTDANNTEPSNANPQPQTGQQAQPNAQTPSGQQVPPNPYSQANQETSGAQTPQPAAQQQPVPPQNPYQDGQNRQSSWPQQPSTQGQWPAQNQNQSQGQPQNQGQWPNQYEPNRTPGAQFGNVSVGMKLLWLALGFFLDIFAVPLPFILYSGGDKRMRNTALLYCLIGLALSFIAYALYLSYGGDASILTGPVSTGTAGSSSTGSAF